MSQEPLTEAIQHYLREIYKLGQGREPVAVGALARAQGVSAASASAMVKKLTALDLAEHPPYRGVSLTPAGETLMANPAMVAMLGYSSFDEMATTNMEDLVTQASYSRQRFKETLDRCSDIHGLASHQPTVAPVSRCRPVCTLLYAFMSLQC